jgi:hypothetical protein
LSRTVEIESIKPTLDFFKSLNTKNPPSNHPLLPGLNSSRRNLQSSLSGSVHGISTGSLRIPPAPPAPTTLPPPHVCISGGIMDDDFDGNGMDDDDEDDGAMEDECQIHLSDDMNVMDAELNNDPFISITTINNANNNNVNHYMNIQSTINPNVNSGANDYYQNVMQMQMQNGESV